MECVDTSRTLKIPNFENRSRERSTKYRNIICPTAAVAVRLNKIVYCCRDGGFRILSCMYVVGVREFAQFGGGACDYYSLSLDDGVPQVLRDGPQVGH